MERKKSIEAIRTGELEQPRVVFRDHKGRIIKGSRLNPHGSNGNKRRFATSFQTFADMHPEKVGALVEQSYEMAQDAAVNPTVRLAYTTFISEQTDGRPPAAPIEAGEAQMIVRMIGTDAPAPQANGNGNGKDSNGHG